MKTAEDIAMDLIFALEGIEVFVTDDNDDDAINMAAISALVPLVEMIKAEARREALEAVIRRLCERCWTGEGHGATTACRVVYDVVYAVNGGPLGAWLASAGGGEGGT